MIKKNGYEILIGGWANKQSVIRKSLQGPAETTVATVDFLSATQFRTFWVQYAKGSIEVGRGTKIGKDKFMSITGSPAISELRAIGYSSWNQKGAYEFLLEGAKK